MALDPVPWFVGGGAEHSPDVARMVAYAATSGMSGVLGTQDFRVTALDVPGTAVRVSAGGAVINNGYLPAPDFGKQSYIARADDVTDVPITATGSGSGRSDLVIVRLDDPQYGGQEPVDVASGPYVRFTTIPNVDPGTTKLPADLGYPAVALARIDLPPQTGTVEQGHIEDLRTKTNPKRERFVRTYALLAEDKDVLDSSAAYEEWPNNQAASWVIDIPSWATAARVIGTWGSYMAPAGSSYGRLKVSIGDTATGDTFETQEVRFDTPGTTGNTRMTTTLGDDIYVPPGFRGTRQRINLMGKVEGGTSATYPFLDWGSSIIVDIEFLEQADAE